MSLDDIPPFTRPSTVYGGPSGAYGVGTGVATEWITAAAAMDPWDGTIWLADWHSACAAMATQLGRDRRKLQNGFWTNQGRFVERREGLSIAAIAGQVFLKQFGHRPILDANDVLKGGRKIPQRT